MHGSASALVGCLSAASVTDGVRPGSYRPSWGGSVDDVAYGIQPRVTFWSGTALLIGPWGWSWRDGPHCSVYPLGLAEDGAGSRIGWDWDCALRRRKRPWSRVARPGRPAQAIEDGSQGKSALVEEFLLMQPNWALSKSRANWPRSALEAAVQEQIRPCRRRWRRSPQSRSLLHDLRPSIFPPESWSCGAPWSKGQGC